MPKEEGSYIQSVDRALSLLEHVALHFGEHPGLTELSEVIGVDKSSVFRLLATLTKHGLIRQEESRKTYQLGFGVYRLASALHKQLKITEIVSPFLKELAAHSNENAHLAVRSGKQAVFIDRERGSTVISTNTNIGDTEELYCTAVGRSLICEMSRVEIEELYRGTPLIPFTDHTITSFDGLQKELDGVRERGFAVDREEYEPNVVCIAAPIYGFEGKVQASIGISGPKERVVSRFDDFAATVKRMGREISAQFGYESATP
ncbi:MAG TPA: IclR family transcriptional regulator [Spirochaetia bacterium]|nr:IclR family transcriptional regulator [Spirochaetia bacterium]